MKHFEEAIMILNQELMMPYIPKKFEEQFLEIKKMCLVKIPQVTTFSIMQPQHLEQVLFTKQNPTTIINSIGHTLAKANLKKYQVVLNKYLMWKQGNDTIKSIIMFAMKDNNMDNSVQVIKKGHIYSFVPKKLKNTYDLVLYKKIINIIDHKFFQKTSQQQMAKYLLFTKLFAAAPKIDNIKKAPIIAAEIIDQIKDYLE